MKYVPQEFCTPSEADSAKFKQLRDLRPTGWGCEVQNENVFNSDDFFRGNRFFYRSHRNVAGNTGGRNRHGKNQDTAVE